MRRLMIVSIILLLLVGCTETKTLEASFKAGLSQALPISTNHNKPYFRYYLPPHVGVKKQDETSSILLINNHEVLMNMRVDYIVSKEFEYTNQEKILEKDPIFSEEKTYVDSDNKMQVLNVRVYELNKKEVLIFADNRKIEMVTVVTKPDMNMTLESMIIILKSSIVFDKEVVSAYSNKVLDKNPGTYSEFFEQVPPETGTIKEMNEKLDPNSGE